MKHLKEHDPESYQRQFSKYIARGINPEDLQGLYEKVHAAIRADPASVKKEKAAPSETPKTKPKRWNKKKKSLAERKARIKQKKAAHAAAEKHE